MNDFHIAIEELGIKVSSRPEIDKVETLFFKIIDEVRRVRICLHYPPLKKLLEAETQH